jgi:hypothetical protein
VHQQRYHRRLLQHLQLVQEQQRRQRRISRRCISSGTNAGGSTRSASSGSSSSSSSSAGSILMLVLPTCWNQSALLPYKKGYSKRHAPYLLPHAATFLNKPQSNAMLRRNRDLTFQTQIWDLELNSGVLNQYSNFSLDFKHKISLLANILTEKFS